MLRIFRSFIANLATLILALVLGVIIWATAVQAEDPTTTLVLSLPVEIVGQPANSVLLDRGHEVVTVVIEGPESAVAELSLDEFRAFIDLNEASFGEREVDINVLFDHRQVRITFQQPERTTIRLEQIVTRDIPVVLDIRGDVARGHSRGEPLVEPDTIQVVGPFSRVSQLTEARITVFLDSTRETIAVTRRPLFYDQLENVASTTNLTFSADTVEVTIPVRELAGFAEKPITANWLGEPATGYRLLNVSVQPNSVLVTGPPATLEQLRGLQTEPIDISGLTQSFSQQVSLVLPEGVTLDEAQPVIVSVEIEPILSSTVIRKAPEVRALGRGLEAVLDPEEVSVFLFGPLPVLDSLEEGDVRVTLDLLNLGVGTYDMSPIVDVFATEVEVRSFQPPIITVVITRAMTTTSELSGMLAPLRSAVGDREQELGYGSVPCSLSPNPCHPAPFATFSLQAVGLPVSYQFSRDEVML